MPGIVALLLAVVFWVNALEAYVRERVDAVRATRAAQVVVETPATVEGVDALRLVIQSELDDPPTRRPSSAPVPDAPFRVALLHAGARGRHDDSRQHAPQRQPVVTYDATAPPFLRPELRSH